MATTEEILDELVEVLEERGVPRGMWLVDIAEVRCTLQNADSLLRRLEYAIERNAGAS